MTGQVVASIMSVPTVGITPAMRASEALSLAYEHHIHHMPVVERGILVGVVCTCDLESVPPDVCVSATLHGPPIVTQPQASSEEALGLMNAHGVGSLMVVQDQRILGIVTRQDLERAGVPMHDDPRGFCSCCGEYEHLREHATGTLCIECFDRSKASEIVDQGGGD